WDRRSINAREAALYARDAGVAAVFIHGRTRSQLYKETVDYGVIRQVKEALDIPVIGSGDVFSPVLAKKMLDETGCDGVLVARGGLGNPWIFNEIESYLADGSLPERPAIDELVDTMLEHYRACCEFHGETIGTMIFRKFFAWYTKGFAHIRPIRMRAFQATQQAGMEAVVNELRSMRRDTGLNIQKRGS
ncbi:MAG: tRNA dihydrouridine synthase DusB, partial [Deltaproteobacteria bacterium]|nr:tRNA dihydrouridine synthase DusB [Deltaproteobacteria bacterium]